MQLGVWHFAEDRFRHSVGGHAGNCARAEEMLRLWGLEVEAAVWLAGFDDVEHITCHIVAFRFRVLFHAIVLRDAGRCIGIAGRSHVSHDVSRVSAGTD